MENSNVLETKERKGCFSRLLLFFWKSARDFASSFSYTVGLIAAVITLLSITINETIFTEERIMALAPYYRWYVFALRLFFVVLCLALFTWQLRLLGFLAGVFMLLLLVVVTLKDQAETLTGIFKSPDCNRVLALAYAVGADSDGEYRFTVSGRNGAMTVNYHKEIAFNHHRTYAISTSGEDRGVELAVKIAVEKLVEAGLTKEEAKETRPSGLDRNEKSYVLTLDGLERAAKEFQKKPIDLQSVDAIEGAASAATPDGKIDEVLWIKLRD